MWKLMTFVLFSKVKYAANLLDIEPMSEKTSQTEYQQSAPVQGQAYISSSNNISHADEISLWGIIVALWKGKWLIILVTAIFAVAAVFYALSLSNEYKSTAMVAPASADSGNNLSKMAGQLGGLASLAGVSIGASESNDATIAMELLKTWGFQEKFIQRHNLEVAIFASTDWNQSRNELIFDESKYDAANKKWIREAPKGKTVEPTSWELYEKFNKNLAVSKDSESGLINISYTHFSPGYAKNITQWLVEDVNAHLKDSALKEASKNIDYLEKQIRKTTLSDMQSVFYTLIEEQTKTKMLADVNDNYVFKIVSSPMLPEDKSRPKRSIIVIAITMLGGFLGVVFILLRLFLRSAKT